MKIEEKKMISVEVEETKNIKCDICQKHLLKKGKTDSVGGSLVGFKLISEDGKLEIEQNESSDFCGICYGELVSYLRAEKKAKIPSFYYNIDVLDNLNEHQEYKRH